MYTLPQANERPRLLIFDWLVVAVALAGTGFCVYAIGAGVVALRAPDGDGMEGIAVIFGAAYLLFFAPALGLASLGIRTRRLEFTLVATIVLVFAVIGTPMVLVAGVFS